MLVASSVVFEALVPVFGQRPQAVLVVSGYDGTVLYANEALGVTARHMAGVSPEALPVDFVGRNVDDVMQLYKIPYEQTAIAKAQASGELVCIPSQGSGTWVCGSPLSLDDRAQIFMSSEHRNETVEQAKAEHLEMRRQALGEIVFCEAERLMQVGMEALHRARQQIQQYRSMMTTEVAEG